MFYKDTFENLKDCYNYVNDYYNDVIANKYELSAFYLCVLREHINDIIKVSYQFKEEVDSHLTSLKIYDTAD